MICKQFICAQQIIVDSYTGAASAINILQDLKATFPSAIPLMAVSSFERTLEETAEPQVTLEIFLNDRPLTSSIPLTVTFPVSAKVARNIINLGIVPIHEPGVLTFKLVCSGTILHTLSVSFIQEIQEHIAN